MAFLVLMVNHLSIKHILSKKRLFSLLTLFLIALLSSTNLKSQDILLGFTGGLNMNIISAENNDGGLKIGCNLGGAALYRIDEKMSILANLKFSTKGQQTAKIQETEGNHLKIYHNTSLYYIDIPILYQYHFKDIIGAGIGPSFNFCLGGKDVSRIGGTTTNIEKYTRGMFNPFEFGLTFGLFTRDLGQSPFNNIFIEFRYFLGLTNILKDNGRNTNRGVFLNICYIIEKPLKKK